MESVESYRKICLAQQTELRRIMMSSTQHNKAVQLFFSQHAMLHSAKMAQIKSWSFEDAVFNDMTEVQIRRIPQGANHSIAWLIWHIARCEDIAMNLLVAGSSQILDRDNWLKSMKVSVCDTGNTMDDVGMANFSNMIDIEALRAYRLAVGLRTREIVKQLSPADLNQKVQPSRIQQVMDEGAVVEAARGIADYWSKRTVAGLLLMPATRHNLIHLYEALQLKRKRK
ncbi:MAG: DinB family protein, partial [Pseudomonadota bacterium]